MALIKKFRIKNFKDPRTILQLDKISMFYNKRQILNNLNFNDIDYSWGLLLIFPIK